MGWENLFSKLRIFQGSDLSSVVTACKTAASSQSQASYCEFKKVKFSDGTKEINCEYESIDLGGLNRLSCLPAITNQYCTKLKTNERREITTIEDTENSAVKTPVRESVMTGLKTCPLDDADKGLYYKVFSETTA